MLKKNSSKTPRVRVTGRDVVGASASPGMHYRSNDPDEHEKFVLPIGAGKNLGDRHLRACM